MKVKMNVLRRITQGLATFGALFTMVMSPVAMGREAQKITVKQLQQGLDEAGLNKQITVGEFYRKNKHLIPARVQKEFEPFVAAYKNQMMPQFEVVSTKGTDGNEVATLRLTQGDELVTVQMIGESDRYAKIQNTYVTEIDVINFNDMFKRVLAGDEKYRKQYESLTAPTEASKGTFTGFPDLTVAAWKGMSQKDRAAYIINMRLLWNDARRVLIEAQKKDSKGRKTSALDSTIEKWDNFFALFSPTVEAAGKGTVKKEAAADRANGAPTVKAGAGSTAFVSGSNCIVAGYVSKYSSSKCSVDNIYDSYQNSENKELIDSTKQFCKSKGDDQIACNPLVYGTPGGSPICISTTNPKDNFQQATHYNGKCDSESRLGSEIKFIDKEDLRNAKRYEKGNRLLSPEELDAKYKEEQKADHTSVENFLNGLLSYKKKAGIDFTKPLTNDSLIEILNIKRAFDNDIKTAKESCELAAANKNNEKNFWGACDQLHRRFLNVAQFLETTPGCKDGSKINPENLKCVCPSGGAEVLPGTSCGSPQPPVACGQGVARPNQNQCVPGPASADLTKPPGKKENCEERFPGATGLNAECKCPGGESPTLSAKSDEGGAEHYTCSGKPEKPEKPEGECGLLCNLGKFAKKFLLPIAATVATVYVLKKIFTPKKPTIKSPGDVCLNGTTAPCAQTCTSPLVLLSTGVCGCAACPTGQSISNAATCYCSSTSTTTTYTCPDGVTKTTDSTLASCPKTNYTCWDGSTVTNPLNCPEKPSSTNTAPGKSTK